MNKAGKLKTLDIDSRGPPLNDYNLLAPIFMCACIIDTQSHLFIWPASQASLSCQVTGDWPDKGYVGKKKKATGFTQTRVGITDWPHTHHSSWENYLIFLSLSFLSHKDGENINALTSINGKIKWDNLCSAYGRFLPFLSMWIKWVLFIFMLPK